MFSRVFKKKDYTPNVDSMKDHANKVRCFLLVCQATASNSVLEEVFVFVFFIHGHDWTT